MLTAQEVAKALNVSPDWVYRHKHALRGFQPAPGCALAFPEKVIQEIQEGTYGLSVEKRTLAGSQDDCRTAENEAVRYESRGAKVGGRAKHRHLAGADRHNLLA